MRAAVAHVLAQFRPTPPQRLHCYRRCSTVLFLRSRYSCSENNNRAPIRLNARAQRNLRTFHSGDDENVTWRGSAAYLSVWAAGPIFCCNSFGSPNTIASDHARLFGCHCRSSGLSVQFPADAACAGSIGRACYQFLASSSTKHRIREHLSGLDKLILLYIITATAY